MNTQKAADFDEIKRLIGLSENIENHNRMEKQDVDLLINRLQNRERFFYTWKESILEWTPYAWIKKCLKMRKQGKVKISDNSTKLSRRMIFLRGKNKLMQELDIVSYLRNMQLLNLIVGTFMDKKQRLLLKA